jgi:putative addiction module component (TIGR02574 family)
MTTQSEAIVNAALTLPEHERLQVAERILETLPSNLDDLDEEEFAAELERRRTEMMNDPSIGIPWKKVLEDE